MGFLDMFKKGGQKDLPEEKQIKTVDVEYQIQGMFALRDEELLTALRCNPDFELSTQDLIEKGYAGKRVYRFEPGYRYGVTLVPEPKNPHDKNAVMVQINGNKVGYIPREEALDVKKALKKGLITGARCYIRGGPTRRIFENGTSMANSYDFEPVVTLTVIKQ